MAIEDIIHRLYPNRIVIPDSVNGIPRDKFSVYILSFNDNAIVVGHGKWKRATIIFDDRVQITSPHFKALLVRSYRLFGKGEFKRFLIPCSDMNEAKVIEANLHNEISGNHRTLPDDILQQLFRDIPTDTKAYMVMRMALLSSYDGIADLMKWRRNGVLDDNVWQIIKDRLQL